MPPYINTDWGNLTMDFKIIGLCASILPTGYERLGLKSDATLALLKKKDFGPMSNRPGVSFM